MGIRSMVGLCIEGPKDKLEFLKKWAPDFFNISDLNRIDDILSQIELNNGNDNTIYYLRWYNNHIKWYLDQAIGNNYPELQQFKMIWQLAEKWGLDGKWLEYCYEYPNPDEDCGYINNGKDLGFPRLSIDILME